MGGAWEVHVTILYYVLYGWPNKITLQQICAVYQTGTIAVYQTGTINTFAHALKKKNISLVNRFVSTDL